MASSSKYVELSGNDYSDDNSDDSIKDPDYKISSESNYLSDASAMEIQPTKEDRKRYFRIQTRVNFLDKNVTNPTAITYKLFTRHNPDEEINLTEESVTSQNLAKNVKTILIIHGWTSNDSSPWYQPLKKAYLNQGAYNIMYIDWSTYGNLGYGQSSANVEPVGEIIASFLVKSGVPAKEIHLVGHSLGAQLAAFISKAYEKKIGRKIGRITALDPAGPKWSNNEMKKEERLSELDAIFVDVLHTDIQLYGYTNPCGHVDYYPNGGTDQPGCGEKNGEKIDENCSHRRACSLFIESISNQVKASEVIFKEDEEYNIVITPKPNPKQVIFGEHVDLEASGVYYLATHSTRPFLQ